MEYRFTLIDYLGVKTEVDEPVDWDSIGKIIQRDRDWHGVFFQFSNKTLEFSGTAYFLMKAEKKRMGVDGDMGLLIEWKCDECEDFIALNNGEPYKLDFEQWDELCGDYCSVKIGINNSTAETTLKNRQDVNVDLSSNIAYDGITVLSNYANLGIDIEIPSKAEMLVSEAHNNGDNVSDNLVTDGVWLAGFPMGDFFSAIFWGFNNIIYQDVPETTFFDKPQHLPGGQNNPLPPGATPFINLSALSEELSCSITDIFLSYRINATVTQTGDNDIFSNCSLDISILPKGADANDPNAFQLLNRKTLWAISGTGSASFDFSLADFAMSINEGDQLYVFGYFQKSQPKHFDSFIITMHDGSFLKFSAKSICDPTPAKNFLIHESMSRIVENITNNQFKFKSDYYGRTDSEPYAAAVDGCGGLRSITNGLQLRRAKLQDGSSPKVFTNFKDQFESLNAIDAIGIGIDPPDPNLDDDTVLGHIRFEPITYFYTRDVILYCDGVKEIQRRFISERIYSQFKCGFDKYETESTNGLDAIHTKREFHTSIINSSNVLEKICKNICDGHAIEVTRRKFGTTEDWRYDQNIFMFALKRDGIIFGVEQGNISSAENLFDPPTVINYRLTPIRNAMRWFHWIMQGVAAVKQLIFNSGDGNYVAKGELSDFNCKLEKDPIAENDTITESSFDFPDDAETFIAPELASFNFPLGKNDFDFISKNKYGLIAFRQDANDDWEYGWIDKITYHPNDGDADFDLILAPLGTSSPVRSSCDGTAAVITSIVQAEGSGVVIFATAYAGTINDIYGSETGAADSYILLASGKTAADLEDGVIIDPVFTYRYFKIHSYNDDDGCDYKYSNVYIYHCTPHPTLSYTDNGDGTITLHVSNVYPGTTLTIFGATEENGTYTQIGSPVTATSGINDIIVSATTYSWFKVSETEENACDYGFTNTVNFVYDACAGNEPTITSIVQITTSSIEIKGSALAGTTISVYGSTSASGPFTHVGGVYTDADLASGITLDSVDYGANTWFKVYSYDANCIYGYSNIVQTTGIHWRSLLSVALGVSGSVGAHVTTYNQITGRPGGYFTPENTTQFIITSACQAFQLSVQTQGAQPGTGTLVVTLRKNGVSTALSVIIPAGAAAGTYEDNTHIVDINENDLIDYEFVNNASSASPVITSVGCTLIG